MQTQHVQSWLRSASMKAAEALGQRRGRQGEMQGYAHMMEALEAELPALLEAVEDLTEGCGTVDLDWRPMQPTSTRLYVSFDCSYTVDLFYRLTDCTEDEAQSAVATVVKALPEGKPFPNRPNAVTGLVARKNRSVGVRVKEHVRDDGAGTAKSVSLLPPNQESTKNLSGPEVIRRLRQLLCSDAPENVSA